MENKIEIFTNQEFGSVRIIREGEKYLFCGADVASALGYSNTRDALRRHCKGDGVVKRDGVSSTTNQHGTTTIQTNAMLFITEGNVYRLITHSKLPSAERFEAWVFEEVLPSIRKHGAYMTDALLTRMDEHPELISEYIGKLRAENAKANAAREALKKAEAENARLAPKASYYDSFVGVESLTCLRYTAKELGVPQKKFIGYLLEKGYVFRDRHRSDRVFVRAGKRNDPLFVTRDFYLPNGTKSEYTLVTPAGKAHFLKIAEKIRVWEPREVAEGKDASEQAVFAACV